MTNKETLKNARYQFAKWLAVLDEAIQLPDEEIENLSLYGMRIDLDKVHTGLIDDVYSLEADLYTLKEKGNQK